MDNFQLVINKIIDQVNPDKIILFGSRARGSNSDNSDYDICILKQNIPNKRELAQSIYKLLLGHSISIDIIVEKLDKFNELHDNKFLIYHEIKKHGLIIYEK